MNGPRRIELMGLPGSGKTTWVREALAIGRLSGARTREDMEAVISDRHAGLPVPLRWARVVAWTLPRARLVTTLVGYESSFDGSVRADGMRQVYRVVRRLHNDALIAETESWRGWRTLVLDQGLVQQVWAIAFLRALPEDAAVRRVLHALGESLPDEVIWVRPSPAVALERMKRRLAARGWPDGDFEERADRLREEDFVRGDRHFAQLARLLVERGVAVSEIERTEVPMEFDDVPVSPGCPNDRGAG